MIKMKRGNLLLAEDIILQAVNCQGAMGAGVAAQIAHKWPKVKQRYVEHVLGMPQESRSKLLGTILPVVVDEDRVVICCFTQEFYGRDKDTRYTSYDAVDECMKKVARWICDNAPNMDVNFPKLGAGLGGGNWQAIYALIDHRIPDGIASKNFWVPETI